MSAPECEAVLRPFIADVLARLDANQQEAYGERAGIIEYEAGVSRPLAESLALLEILKRWPSLLLPWVALECELAGETRWLLTTDLRFARHHLAEFGGQEKAVHDPADVIQHQFGNAALLVRLG